MKKHYQILHLCDKPIPCDWAGCNLMFGDKSIQQVHYRKSHQKESQVTCEADACGRSFFDDASLRRHRKGTTYPFSNLLVVIFFSLSIAYPFSLSRQVFRLHGVEPDQQPLALSRASGNLISNYTTTGHRLASSFITLQPIALTFPP